VIDQWSRESVLMEANAALTGQSVVDALEALSGHRPLPKAITLDHGTEFTSKALDEWAYRRGVQLDFIRPGKPVENAFIESFKGRLRDECLNVYSFVSIAHARALIETWRRDYNTQDGAPGAVIALVQQLMPLLIAGDHPAPAILRRQLADAAVAGVEMTGAGFYAEFTVPPSCPLTDPPNFSGGDAVLTLDTAPAGGGCVLHVRYGRLEGRASSDPRFPTVDCNACRRG